MTSRDRVAEQQRRALAVANGRVSVPFGGLCGDYVEYVTVLRLAPDPSVRLDLFAPMSWGSQNARDRDLGSTGPVLLDGDRVLVSGKDAVVYLLDAQHLGGIGGQLATLTGCAGYGGIAWDASAQAALVPCTDGLLRAGVGATTSRFTSPVLAGGIVVATVAGVAALTVT